MVERDLVDLDPVVRDAEVSFEGVSNVLRDSIAGRVEIADNEQDQFPLLARLKRLAIFFFTVGPDIPRLMVSGML